MFAGLQGWHLLIILTVISPIVLLAIGLPISIAQGRARREQGLVTDPRTNTLSIIAFVLSFFVGIVAVVCGHLARARIRASGEAGWGFATWALFAGYYGTVLGVLVAVGTIASLVAKG
ncbi:DUF4190 domain-containing protein [Microbacteriaceae bacterium VKM Ac-2854]|nr:DUF4190 domain-containing protein [Microbacteriaceae bacterium VKM Ac-2854]